MRITTTTSLLSAVLLGAGLTAAPASASAAPAPRPAPHHGPGHAHHAPCPDRVELPVGFRPEGITSGPGSTIYVGSLAGGAIWTGDLRSGEGRILLAAAEGRSLRGLFHDRATGLVWAVGTEAEQGVVLAVDARTGAVAARITVEGAAFLNDLVITRDALYVTDSMQERLTRIPLAKGRWNGADPQFLTLAHPDWPADGWVRVNGIRALSDGTLVVAHSAVGGLWQVDPATGSVARIPVTGAPALTSGDGLELRGDALYVVRGSGEQSVTVVRLSRAGGAWRGTVSGLLESDDLDVPSTATLAAGRLWAVNARFSSADPDAAEYWVTALPTRPSHRTPATPSKPRG